MSGERACPVCADAPLDDEGRCGSCGGALVADAAGALARVGVDRELLVGVLEEAGSLGHLCPGCGYQMTRAPVRGEMIDVCQGCGALWADAAELARVEGVDVARAPLPRVARALERAVKPGALRRSPAKYALIAAINVVPLTLTLAYEHLGLGVLAVAAGAGFLWFTDVALRTDPKAGSLCVRQVGRWFEIPADDVERVIVGGRRWFRHPIFVSTGEKVHLVCHAATPGGAIAAAQKIARLIGLPPEEVRVP